MRLEGNDQKGAKKKKCQVLERKLRGSTELVSRALLSYSRTASAENSL